MTDERSRLASEDVPEGERTEADEQLRDDDVAEGFGSGGIGAIGGAVAATAAGGPVGGALGALAATLGGAAVGGRVEDAAEEDVADDRSSYDVPR